MADLDEKKKGPLANEIPVPVVAVPPPARRSPWRQVLLRFVTFTLVFTWFFSCTRRWSNAGAEKELEVHEGRWMSLVFGEKTWRQRHHHKVLHGKKAEKLFLCVPTHSSRALHVKTPI